MITKRTKQCSKLSNGTLWQNVSNQAKNFLIDAEGAAMRAARDSFKCETGLCYFHIVKNWLEKLKRGLCKFFWSKGICYDLYKKLQTLAFLSDIKDVEATFKDEFESYAYTLSESTLNDVLFLYTYTITI